MHAFHPRDDAKHALLTANLVQNRRCSCAFYTLASKMLHHTWFMPALAKRRVGSSWGTTGLDFQKVWSCLSVKNEMNESRTLDAGQPLSENSETHRNPEEEVVCRREVAESGGK